MGGYDPGLAVRPDHPRPLRYQSATCGGSSSQAARCFYRFPARSTSPAPKERCAPSDSTTSTSRRPAKQPGRARQCAAPWPCETAASYLTPGQCGCGSPTWWETRGLRHWHPGPRCQTAAEAVAARAVDAAKGRPPHYPPSHYYPAKPRRACRQQPPTGTPRPGPATSARAPGRGFGPADSTPAGATSTTSP